MDALRLPRALCRAADRPQGIRRSRTGRWRHLVDAVPLHRAVLPAAAVSLDPVLPHGRRAPRLRPCVHPHRRRPGNGHAIAQPLHLPDRVPVFRRRAGGGARGPGIGRDQHPLLARDPSPSPGARLMQAPTLPSPRGGGKRLAIALRLILIVAGLGMAAFLYAFPLYWLIATSLKSKAELYQSITLFPRHPTLEPYFSVLVDRGFWVLLKNSVIVCAATVLVTLAVGLVITYPITRLSVPPRLRVGVLNWALSLRFLPPVAVVVPYFAIVRTLQIYNQPIALIGIYSLFNLPFAIWMLKGFLAEIPLELEEAALVDGANRWTSFRRVLLPLAAPGLVAAAAVPFPLAGKALSFAPVLSAAPPAQTLPRGDPAPGHHLE